MRAPGSRGAPPFPMENRILMRFVAAGALALLLPALPALAQDPPSGEAVFRSQCSACHQIDTRNRVGPGLAGSFGRRAGAAEGFRFSTALRARAEGGLTWDEENLRAYLRNPKEVVPGGSMPYAGLRDEARLDALMAFLKERASP